MYDEIINLIVKLGNELPELAGKIEDIGVKKKWLTDKDIEIEKELAELIQTFPGEHKIFAEELNDSFVNGESVWVIDPISHTYNFIHGLPHYAVVLSHLVKGELMFSIIYDPSMKELFAANKGKGAYLNNQPISVSKSSDNLSLIFDPSSATKEKIDSNLEIMKKLYSIGRVKTFGSFGLHYAYVACGRAEGAVSDLKDVFPEFAGKLLVEEAGGKLTDFKGNDLNIETRAVIASNGLIHNKLLEIVK